MTDISKIERQLRDALNDAIKNGWTIQRGVTVDGDNKQCCALGAVRIKENEETCNNYWEIGLAIGMTEEQVDDFVEGFDSGNSEGDEFHKLGAELSEEYVQENEE